QAVTSMDETTQQNAALVEEAAAAAESLVDQANQLADAISQFKLEGKSFGGGHAVAHKAAPKHTPVKAVAHTSSQNSSSAYRDSGYGKSSSSGSSSPPPIKSTASKRTGTDDSDWEEF
ncbi:MAG TPA: chemotaxis protein, partial [Methylophilus sp.]|nr:chemotaxis protein [Methylophilus sp.]